ncbi:MAG: PepSY domain-containing protein [Bryobacter sp.]
MLKLRKYAILYHRWLGVFFALLFVMWFGSGFVLMYWPYPAVKEAERLDRASVLQAASVTLDASTAYAKALAAEAPQTPPDRVRLSTLAGRPVYRFHYGRKVFSIYADDGSAVAPVAEPLARSIAAHWTGKAAEQAQLMGALTEEDQWTLNKAVRPLRPFYKYAWPTGEEVYISQVTGEVMQATTTASRWGAWLGAIPHWLYYTPIRSDTASWRVLVIWLSSIGTVMTLLGIVVGIWLYSPSQRYRFPEGPSSIPYAGWKRWHTILGLVFGLVTFTWILSGMFSMNPNSWSPEFGPDPAYSAMLRGSEWRAEPFAAEPPAQALARLGNSFLSTGVKDLELFYFAGQPHYRARSSSRTSQLLAVGGQPVPALSGEAIRAAFAPKVQGGEIAEFRAVREYENYYVDRHGDKPLPVYFLRHADTSHYIDPASGAIVSSYNALSKANRWLYHGLHSLDFPVLYKYRPLWDIVVLLLLVGGMALSLTSVWIGAQRVRRWVVQGRRKTAVPTNSPAALPIAARLESSREL